MKPDPGSCTSFKYRYYYDVQSAKCLHLNYSGCGGNNNNFDSFLDCLDACSGASNLHYKPLNRCELPKDSGKCKEKVLINAKSESTHALS